MQRHIRRWYRFSLCIRWQRLWHFAWSFYIFARHLFVGHVSRLLCPRVLHFGTFKNKKTKYAAAEYNCYSLNLPPGCRTDYRYSMTAGTMESSWNPGNGGKLRALSSSVSCYGVNSYFVDRQDVFFHMECKCGFVCVHFAVLDLSSFFRDC